jgi:hypothetical protein
MSKEKQQKNTAEYAVFIDIFPGKNYTESGKPQK